MSMTILGGNMTTADSHGFLRSSQLRGMEQDVNSRAVGSKDTPRRCHRPLKGGQSPHVD